MEVLRYKYIFIVISLLLNCVSNDESKSNPTGTTPNCPFSKIIEDVFKVHNNTTDKNLYSKDKERVKLFLSTIANITNENISRKDEDLINVIIASINRIKNNISDTSDRLNEAIIVSSQGSSGNKKVTQIKSGIEEKIDITRNDNTIKKHTTKSIESHEDIYTTEKTKYVEIFTKDPNTKNTTSTNIIEVLKHLMPLFNSTSAKKEVHNITIIERDPNNNHSSTANKNVSTIIVTYCDKENSTNVNKTKVDKESEEKHDDVTRDEYYDDEDDLEMDEEGEAQNITLGEKKEIMEAAEYGMQKMHELYSVLEPKLYSMGFWLDDSSPARYVAAFNAPSEDAAKFSRYGYASLQAATKLKQLTRELNDPAYEGIDLRSNFQYTKRSVYGLIETGIPISHLNDILMKCEIKK